MENHVSFRRAQSDLELAVYEEDYFPTLSTSMRAVPLIVSGACSASPCTPKVFERAAPRDPQLVEPNVTKQQSAPTPCDAATFHGLSAKDLGRGVAGTRKCIQFLQTLPKLFEKAKHPIVQEDGSYTCTTKHGQSSVPWVELCHRIPIFFESAMQCKLRDYGRHVHAKLAQLLPDSNAAKAAKELKMLSPTWQGTATESRLLRRYFTQGYPSQMQQTDRPYQRAHKEAYRPGAWAQIVTWIIPLTLEKRTHCCPGKANTG